jgi:hypothetical protein
MKGNGEENSEAHLLLEAKRSTDGDNKKHLAPVEGLAPSRQSRSQVTGVDDGDGERDVWYAQPECTEQKR